MTAYVIIMRTIVEIPDEVVQALDRVCVHEKRSRAALIREAVSSYLSRNSPDPSDSGAFGIWKHRNVDGVKYQRQLRNEWEDR